MKTLNVCVLMKAACFAVCGVLFTSNALGADRTWTGLGDATYWHDAANWSDNAVPTGNGDVAIFTNTATVAVVDNRSIKIIRSLNGNAVINIDSGIMLTIDNGGAEGLSANGGNLTVNGPGKLGYSTGEGAGSAGYNHLDSGADLGWTLAIYAEIVDRSGGVNTGFESWRADGETRGGTIILGYPANAFVMNMNASQNHTFIVEKFSPLGQPSSIGAPNVIRPNKNTVFHYVGMGGDTAGPKIEMNGGSASLGYGAGITHDGLGTLTWAGDIYNVNNSAQILTLAGGSAFPAAISGNIYNNQGSLAIVKNGSGAWILSGNNTFTGGLTVNAGTLGLDSPGAAGNVLQITMADSTTLKVNPSEAAGFVASYPLVAVAGGLSLTVGAGTDVTLAGLSAASVAVTLANNASLRISGFPSGAVGPWLTLNGGPAQYNDVNGLIPLSLTQQGIAVKGNTLPNGAHIEALINLAAANQTPLQIADPTTLYSLIMAYAFDDAIVATAGKTLFANEVGINAGATNLTIGVAPQDGILLPPLQALPPPSMPDNTDIANLNPLIWYDPADTATVSVYAGIVTGLANKGSSGATHDAVPRTVSGGSGPIYATGTDSHAALPMLKIDANTQGLQSQNLTGVFGNANRTLFAVMSHPNAETYVSIGVNQTSRDFSIRMWVDSGGVRQVRFNTWSGDRDIVAPPAETPVVLTFASGVDNGSGPQPYNLLAAMDGATAAPWGPNSNNLNTDNTTLNLGFTDPGTGGSNNSGRGQIGEILLFDYTLSAQERKVVEDYLKAKWKQVKVSGGANQNGTLLLRNDSDADLTVNAAVTEPTGSLVTLVKTGPGDVILAGGVTVSDRSLIDSGTLFVNTPDGATDTLGGIISGAGKLTKDGPGLLILPYSALNLYLGGTDILGGTLLIGNSRSTGPGDITIADGATLDIGAGTTANTLSLTNRITVTGAGKDGLGAIVNNGLLEQQNAIQNTTVTLLGPTTFGGTTRWDFRDTRNILDLDGNTLTKVGPNTIFFAGGTAVSNAPAGTAFDIQEGYLGLHAPNTPLDPNDPTREIAIADGAGLLMYGQADPVNWTLVLADGAEIGVTGTDEYTNKNVLATDVFLDNGVNLHLTSSGSFTKTFTGELHGDGGITVRNGGGRAMTLLAHPANTFTGPVAISNAVLGLRYPDSLPGGLAAIPGIRLANLGGVRAYLGTDGWTLSDVLTLMASPIFNATAQNNQRLQIDVAPDEAYAIPVPITSAFRADIDKYGTGTLAFDHDIDMAVGNIRSHSGTLLFENDTTVNLNNQNLYLGDGAPVDGTSNLTTTRISGTTAILSNDRGYQTTGPVVGIGYHNGRSVLDFTDNASITAKFVLGGLDNGDTAAHGAIYQSGNASWLSTGGASNDSILGAYGYGYWHIDGGELLMKGYTILGWAEAGTSAGILRQTGGAITFNGSCEAAPSTGTVGDSYGGWIDLSRGGRADLHLAGGTFTHYGQIKLLADGSGNNGNNNGGHAVMTVTGTADAWIDRQIEMGFRNGSATTALNINGGRLAATRIQSRKRDANTTVSVNFNGGTFHAYDSDNTSFNNFSLIGRDNTAHAVNVCIYGNGGTIDIADGATRILDIPLIGALGQCIAAIPVGASGTGYIAPPHVAITGGGGSGATAIAHIDRLTGQLTDIEITCPGRNYTATNITVTLTGGGGSGAGFNNITLGENTPGGLTKAGGGTLILRAANGYIGPLRVDGGILRLEHPEALHPSTDVTIGDGILDLCGHTVTVSTVTLTGTGGIVNGTIATSSAVKTGPGTAIWDAAIAWTPRPPTPGLWEGQRKGVNGNYWVTDYPNPKTSIQLTTRAGNVPNGANNTAPRAEFWNGNYNMWIYTGLIWNRSDQPVTWSFRGAFDDDVYLAIDDVELLRNNGNSWKKATITVDPGPHKIDIRFGDGTGNVGPYQNQTSGLMFDPLGRNSDSQNEYIILRDPGDGSLLTIEPDSSEPDNVIRIEEGTLLLPSDDTAWNAPGLWEGRLTGNMAFGANPSTAVELTTTAANGYCDENGSINDKHWPNNSTYIYTGYIWNRTPGPVTWNFAENFDDKVLLIIAEQTILDDTTYNNPTVGAITLDPGPHPFEVRFAQGSGGAGGVNSFWWTDREFSFGIDFSGRPLEDASNSVHYVILEDPGDGSLLTRTVTYLNPGALNGATIVVSGGATLDLGGLPRTGLIITGEGQVINAAPGSTYTLSPAGDDRTGSLSVNGIGSLDGVTYRVTIHDPPFPAVIIPFTPGLWEGRVSQGTGNIDRNTPNPCDAIELTFAATKGFGSTDNGPIFLNGKEWASHTTYVYSGYLWSHAETNETWTFAKSFDDHLVLIINGVTYIDHGTWDEMPKVQIPIKPGPNSIEARFGQGGGGVGAVNNSNKAGHQWWPVNTISLAVDKLGRGESDFSYYEELVDPGDGSVFTLEDSIPPPIPGETLTSDVITSAGVLDLTGLTIVPSDLLSATPPKSKYLIATAAGFTGIPTLDGFDPKWKTRKEGANLWLTTIGGTVLILR